MHTPANMQLIGYWISGLKNEEFCAPQEVVGYLAPDVRRRLGDYLDAGDCYEKYMGYSYCRFGCGIPDNEMGDGERTDGCWVWPDGLSHYIRAHGIMLPEEFIAHALAQTPRDRPRRDSEAYLQRLLRASTTKNWATDRPSSDFWKAWCSSRRSPVFLQRLRSARVEADRRAQETVERLIAEEVGRHGLSDKPCIYAGCKEKALSGILVCARHTLGDTVNDIALGCYVIPRELIASIQSTEAAKTITAENP